MIRFPFDAGICAARHSASTQRLCQGQDAIKGCAEAWEGVGESRRLHRQDSRNGGRRTTPHFSCAARGGCQSKLSSSGSARRHPIGRTIAHSLNRGWGSGCGERGLVFPRRLSTLYSRRRLACTRSRESLFDFVPLLNKSRNISRAGGRLDFRAWSLVRSAFSSTNQSADGRGSLEIMDVSV
jgi:hypothetical protein